MAVVIPSQATEAVADRLTAALWNDDVAAAVQFLLGQGSNPRPLCHVYNSANISCATSGTAQLMTFDTDYIDASGMHDPASNPSRITFPVTGQYEVIPVIRFASNATGYRQIDFRLNAGGNVAAGTGILTHTIMAANGAATSVRAPFQDRFTAGDYCEMWGTQSSGAALNALAGRHQLALTIRFLST